MNIMKESLTPFYNKLDKRSDKINIILEMIKNKKVSVSNFRFNEISNNFYGLFYNGIITPKKTVGNGYEDCLKFVNEEYLPYFSEFRCVFIGDEFFFQFKLKM